MAAVQMSSPAPRAAWREVLAEDPEATVQQTPAWTDAIGQAIGAEDVSRLYELPDGRRLVLPMLRRSLAPRVVLDDSMAAPWGRGGLVATGGLRRRDVESVVTDLQKHTPAVLTRLRSDFHTVDRWVDGRFPGVINVPGRVHVLDLEGGFAHIWQERFEPTARRAVHKAESAGLVVERDTSGTSIPVFYDLYRSWTARRAEERGMPLWLAARLLQRREPLKVFRSVSARLGDECRIWVAWHDGEPVASIITLVHGQYAAYWRGYSDKVHASPTRANNLLQKLAIEDACAAGCRFYLMGESGGVKSLERFKRTLGATPRPVVETRIERMPFTRIDEVRHRAEAGTLRLLSRRRHEVEPVPVPG